MAAPTVSIRGVPASPPMDDGFSTRIAFKSDLTVEFWEVEVQPPGMDGGDEIETTTMLNNAWRTFVPRNLKTLTEVTATVAYSPALYASGAIDALINTYDEITVAFPGAGTPSDGDGVRGVAFWGFLKSFIPGTHVEGEQPRAEIVIRPTNWDGTAEQGPVYDTDLSAT